MEDKYLDIEEGNQTELVDGEREQLNPTVNQEAKPIYVADPSRTDIVKAAIENVLDIDGKLPSNEKGLLVPAFYKKDIENICIDAILKAIEEGTIHIGGGEVVEGGYTLQLLDAEDKNFYVFNGKPNSQIDGVKPYPLKQGKKFVGWTAIKDDSSTLQNFPITLDNNKKLYAFFNDGEMCHITNLGAQHPIDVIFQKTDTFPTESQAWENVVFEGDSFAKFTPWYKKVVADENGNVRQIYISDVKIDDSYHIYDCFLDENGNELPYILIGQYCFTSTTRASSIAGSPISSNIGTLRALARAKGTGYQLWDWSIYNFWRDLAMAIKGTVNFNSGSGVSYYLGLFNLATSVFFDGIALEDYTYLYSNKPSKYVNEPTSNTEGYVSLSYSAPSNSGGVVKEIGYDINNPNINLPSSVSGSDFSIYYCDIYYGYNGKRSVATNIGDAGINRGLFLFDGTLDFTTGTRGARLCYRPIGGN